jgi:LysM repeat protein
MTQSVGSLARWIAVIGLALLIAACGGGDDDDSEVTPTPDAGTAAATATPLAVVPEPTIVAAGVPPDQPSGEVTYLVEAGDTLSAIAERFDTSVVAIQDANELTGTNIFVGQELTIPSGNASGDDTSGGDASGGGASGGGASGGGDAGGTNGGGGENPATYTVQPGDLASLVAERFNVTLDALAEANDTTVEELNNIFVGQVLNIPPAN